MARFKEISPLEIEGNAIEKISKEWMLVAAENGGRVNMMTASWGALGCFWNKPAAITVIRPQRYTWEFIEASDTFSLTFFGGEYREQLNLCGSKSGRDIDKIAETSFNVLHDAGTPYFEEAKLVLICKKLYVGRFEPECFVDGTIPAQHYPKNDFHKIVVGEIVRVLEKNED